MLSLAIKACGFGTGLTSFVCGSGSANNSTEGLEKKSTAFGAEGADGGARTAGLDDVEEGEE